MKQTQQITVRVTGQGDSKQKAFSSALSQIQREVLKNTNNIILRIEPLDLAVISHKHEITTEKFLFFFFARQKAFYQVTLDVTVMLSFVDLNQVGF